ncbi:MAG: hypothetical protein HFE63_11400 [Clostridiales bacterium]|nr:hypothetical protein [Clostridiales bacterium]
MQIRTGKKALYPVICIVGIALLLISVFGLIDYMVNKAENADSNIYGDNIPPDDGARIFYDSDWYELNKKISTMLVIGVDELAGSDSKQSDFLALVVMNDSEKTFKILHLNRDTMTSIPTINVDGKTANSFIGQLALAHTYGKDETQRCKNTVSAVKNLLYNVDIDHYLSLTMDAIPILNDAVGGVTVELMDDLYELGDDFTKGSTHTLMGRQALVYVRARSSLEDSTNLHRMERQRQYIEALFNQYFGTDKISGLNVVDTLLSVNEYMASDFTVQQLSTLNNKLSEYEYQGIIPLDGEAVLGDTYMEYYVDESAVQEIVINLFYKKCTD